MNLLSSREGRVRCQGYGAFVVAALLANLFAANAQANTLIFTYNNNSTIDVQARFDIDNSAKTVTVYLLNLQQNPADFSGVLGSVRFTVGNIDTTATPLPSMTGSSYSTFNVTASGAPGPAGAAPNWIFSTSGSQARLCTVCAGGSGSGMIIGGPDPASGKYAQTLKKTDFIIASGGTYSSGALQGLDTNPDWVFSFPGITQGQPVTITNVIFGFGTIDGSNTITVANPTEAFAPEPRPIGIISAGLSLICFAFGWRKVRNS